MNPERLTCLHSTGRGTTMSRAGSGWSEGNRRSIVTPASTWGLCQPPIFTHLALATIRRWQRCKR